MVVVDATCTIAPVTVNSTFEHVNVHASRCVKKTKIQASGDYCNVTLTPLVDSHFYAILTHFANSTNCTVTFHIDTSASVTLGAAVLLVMSLFVGCGACHECRKKSK